MAPSRSGMVMLRVCISVFLFRLGAGHESRQCHRRTLDVLMTILLPYGDNLWSRLLAPHERHDSRKLLAESRAAAAQPPAQKKFAVPA
jgi:hypothetical protein